MPIADSDAISDESKVLPQHQAFLTMLADALSDPSTEAARWLDLECGRGQILLNLDENLAASARGKLHYSGYDIEHRFIQEAGHAASDLGLGSYGLKVGELAAFSTLYDPSAKFDFITLVNAAHELDPSDLALVLVDAVLRLSQTGLLFACDVETVVPFELGAVPWTSVDVRQMFGSLWDALGVEMYEPAVSRFTHRSRTTWSVHVGRQHLAMDQEKIESLRDDMVSQLGSTLATLLEAKLGATRAALDKLTRFGPETGDEETFRHSLLYDFWALSYALEKLK